MIKCENCGNDCSMFFRYEGELLCMECLFKIFKVRSYTEYYYQGELLGDEDEMDYENIAKILGPGVEFLE